MTPADRSLWSDTMPAHERTRYPPLDGDGDADVAIVGAGLTGLWTAWYLLAGDPGIRVVIVERESIGFGASGRNGGWCSAFLPMSLSSIAKRHGDAAASRMQRAMHAAVDEVVAFASAHADSAVARHSGTIGLARTDPQRERVRRHLDEYRRFGFGDADYRWMPADEAQAVCNASGTIGAMWTPHCAVVHPLRLTHAVADAVASAGGVIHECTAARELAHRRVVTDRGTIRADVVVRATEGYTPQLPGERRTVIPICSMMIATEPLPDAVWDDIGLADRPTFTDGRRMVIYGQRTADGRIAFGGRGAPYHFGSRIRPDFDTDARIQSLLESSLAALFPALGGIRATHHWGGVLAAPRDRTCGVTFDRATGSATAGGYVGDGVATANLAGRTLATLIGGAEACDGDELDRLPWVGHRSRRWEPEPLRWLGVNAAQIAARRADAGEHRTGRRSRIWGGTIDLLRGHS